MEVKKSPKADLEGKKTTWLLVGFVVVLAFMFVSFEFTRRDKKVDTTPVVAEVVFEQEIIPITETPEPTAPPPPAEMPKVAETIEIVDDKTEVEETITTSIEDLSVKVDVKYVVPMQVVEEVPEEQDIFEVVEDAPEFPGGQAALMKYLSKSIKYPTISQETGTQGRVIVQFIVNKDGGIVDAKVVRGVDPHLDKEALRVVNTMPKWKPGMQRKKPVRVRFTLPIMFRLN